MRAATRTLPPLVETARREVRVAMGAALVAVLLVLLVAAREAQHSVVARTEAFVGDFVASAASGTEFHRRFTAPGAARDVEDSRRWMTSDARVLGCEPLGLALSPRHHECVVRFVNGGVAHLYVVEHDASASVWLNGLAPKAP